MKARYRRAWIACLAAAASAVIAALAMAGLRVFGAAHRMLEIFAGDRGDPIAAPDLTAALLLLAGVIFAIGAAALAIAGRRAALALERASLIEQL
jgi:hypothetical protein